MLFTDALRKLALGVLAVVALASCSNGVQSGTLVSQFAGIQGGVAISPTAAKLSWTRKDGIKEYRIYNSQGATPIGTTALDYYIVENLEPNKTYTFKVLGTDGTESYGVEKEVVITTWKRFEGLTAVTIDANGVAELSWDYDQFPSDYQVFYMKDVAPTAANTNNWATPNLRTGSRKVNLTNLEPSSVYYFMVHAVYREGETEITSKTLSLTTLTSFATPAYLLSPISIGSLPSLRVTPVQDAKHSNQFYKSTVYWNGSPISDPLTGPGNIVFSSNIKLPLGKLENISLRVDYNDGNLSEGMTISGLSTFIKGLSPVIEKPPVTSLGAGASYVGKALASGDFNCDGGDDLAVGIPDISIASLGMRNVRSGAVLIFYSVLDPDTGLYTLKTDIEPKINPAVPGVDPQIITFDDLRNNEAFGTSLSSGNLNGDKNGLNECKDLIVGAPRSFSQKYQRQDGAAYIFFGSTKGLSAPAHASDIPENTSTCNGDLAAAICSSVKVYEDRAILPTNLQATSSTAAEDSFGTSVAFIGDFNADGFEDVAIGAPNAAFDGRITGYSTANAALNQVGAVYIYFGSKFGLGYEYPRATGSPSSSDQKFRYLKIYPPLPVENMHFGASIAGGADVDGKYKVRLRDGTLAGGADMIIGAPDFNYSNYSLNNPLGTTVYNDPDAAGFLLNAGGTDGWWNAGSSTLASSTSYYGIPQNNTAVGAAFLYFGRGHTSPRSLTDVESPTRADFWKCGRRGLSDLQHYSCLVDNTNVVMLSPRDNITRKFGAAVALMGSPSRYKENSNDILTAADSDPLVPRQYFSDANGDGYADVVVTAPLTSVGGLGNVGVLWQYFGNANRLFEPRSFTGASGDSPAVPSKEWAVNDPTCSGFSGSSNATKMLCKPVLLRTGSLGAGSQIGNSHARIAVGDVTGDGLKDLAVGAPGDTSLGNASGSALVFTSTKDQGLTSNYKKIYTTTVDEGDAFGSSVTLGNFNGDFNTVAGVAPTTAVTKFPYYDIFAGSPNDEVNRPGGGGVYGFISAGLSLPATVNNHNILITENLASFQEFGLHETRLVGDINGDGYADAVSKIKGTLPDGSSKFDAVVYFGSSIGLITTSFCLENQVRIFGGTGHEASCYPTATPSTALNDMQLPQLIVRPSTLPAQWAYLPVNAGDVNGDGFDDVFFVPTSAGSSVIFYGARGGLLNVVDPSWTPNAGDAQIVTNTISANSETTDSYSHNHMRYRVPYKSADLNGDGYDDLIIGQPWATSPGMNTAANPYLPRPDAGYPTGATNGSGWACGATNNPSCTSGTGVWGYGEIKIFYGSARGYQTPRNNGLSTTADATAGSPGVLDIYDTETLATKPCEAVINPVCKVVHIRNPVWENIPFGYDRLGHRFGFSLTIADVNKDGYPDLLAGAPGYEDLSCWTGSNTTRDQGRVYIFYGGQTGVLASSRFDYYNHDLTAACPLSADIDPATGLMTGSTKVRALSPTLFTYGLGGNNSGRGFGHNISTAGDVNTDMYEDVIISATNESLPGAANIGAHYMYYGPICPADNHPTLMETVQDQENLNRQMFFNGQAPSGTPATDIYSGVLPATQTASCFRGNGSTMKPAPQKFQVYGASAEELWGQTLVGLPMGKGDFNKDGYDDIIVGSGYSDNTTKNLVDSGRGVVFFGGPNGLYTADYPATSVITNSSGNYRPFSIIPEGYGAGTQFFYGNVSAADINGDGSMDLMVPSALYDGTGSNIGINLGTFFLFY